jgi:hypothetical protein
LGLTVRQTWSGEREKRERERAKSGGAQEMRTGRLRNILLWPVLLFGRAKEREQHSTDEVEAPPPSHRGEVSMSYRSWEHRMVFVVRNSHTSFTMLW